MKQLLLIVSLYGSRNVYGQSVQKEINAQVWSPFIKAFNSHNTKSFMAVHSKDVVRSPRDSKVVWNYDEYYKEQEKGDQMEISAKNNRQLELHFTERIAGLNRAVEVGSIKRHT